MQNIKNKLLQIFQFRKIYSRVSDDGSVHSAFVIFQSTPFVTKRVYDNDKGTHFSATFRRKLIIDLWLLKINIEWKTKKFKKITTPLPDF